ncbi:MAG: CPXCG motif-containing cysteine-rich protein [Lysobacter sp.]|nr:CPXCG motif-containing cysteine-rich protein [Lysobacter sp.]
MSSLPGATVRCPYCGERIELLVDIAAGAEHADAQEYVEDCPVCCRPIAVGVAVDDGGFRVAARADHEA